MTIRHTDPKAPKRGLYPPIDARRSGHLRRGIHEVYWEESGNPDGTPVVFLHGGPGGGTDPKHRRFFDPARYRIVLFDQRGCGRSRPHASLEDNTTWHLVDDIEALREHLGVDRWQVCGGSWGSTLAVAYAQRHTERVSGLVLRGIFLFTDAEMRWFYGEGTRMLFPDAWDAFVDPIPPGERGDLLRAYHRRLVGDDHAEAVRFARAWSLYECRVAGLLPDPGVEAHCDDPRFTLPFARIESHYFVHDGFLDHPDQLLDGLASLAGIPTVVVHGRYDVICPARNAYRLHERLPDADLVFVTDAGHSAFEPGIIDQLVRATDRFAST